MNRNENLENYFKELFQILSRNIIGLSETSNETSGARNVN